jgi:3-isopropylmalate/(R)-2-methylmalate dehydratase small subunit
MSAAKTITGAAFVFGANVDTDIIIPARYLITTDPRELAAHAMEPVRPDFAGLVGERGGVVVAGDNFGCGSSREHAPVALIGAGIRCVVAGSLARIFYRNCINTGLPAVMCPGVDERVAEGDSLEIDLAAGRLVDLTRGETLAFEPLPGFMMGILAAGGLIPYLKERGLAFS